MCGTRWRPCSVVIKSLVDLNKWLENPQVLKPVTGSMKGWSHQSEGKDRTSLRVGSTLDQSLFSFVERKEAKCCAHSMIQLTSIININPSKVNTQGHTQYSHCTRDSIANIKMYRDTTSLHK